MGPQVVGQRTQPATAENDATLTLLAVLDVFRQPIPPVRRSPLYNISVFLVAVTLILLPLFYICLVGMTAFVIVYHLSEHMGLLAHGLPGWLTYSLPALFGIVFLLFMIKPLFARQAMSPRLSLDRQQEPVLFGFVEHLCSSVGAPVPRRIDVDIEANASASFRRGLISVFDDDLVLTIGLPLAAGLNLQQFTGVLAHEFGHFTQGSAMRFGFIVGRINHWFARVVYERDSWDEQLLKWSETIPARLGGAILLALRFFVWLTRGILWILMQIGQMISCIMSRQMEFDADQYENYVSGTAAFAQTSLDLHTLWLALGMAHDDLQQSWLENRLGDDLPALVVANAQILRERPETMREIHDSVLNSRTGWFDAHPSTSARIQRARQHKTPGIFRFDAPASVLFRDFTGLCKAVSLEYYRENLEQPVDERNLIPTHVLVAEQRETAAARKTLLRYFQGKVLGWHEIFLPPEAAVAPQEPPVVLEQLRRARQSMLAQLERTADAVRLFDQAQERLRELSLALLIVDSGLKIQPSHFNLVSSKRDGIVRAQQQAEHDRAARLVQLDSLLLGARLRITAALQLLRAPEVSQRMADGSALAQRCTALLTTLQALERAWPNVLCLREVRSALGVLLSTLEDVECTQQLDQQIRRLSRLAAELTSTIRTQLASDDYPFQHARGAISLADYALAAVPDQDEPYTVVCSAGEMLEKLVNLYYRVLAHLAVAAETVETTLGMPPLADVVEEETHCPEAK